MLSGISLCDELITRPRESYRLWSVVCKLELSIIRRPWPTGGCRAKKRKRYGPVDGSPLHVLRVSASNLISGIEYSVLRNGKR